MEVVDECCCGLDVQAKTVVACLVTKGRKEIRPVATMSDELLQLGDWLSSAGCPHVAREHRGILEAGGQQSRKPADRHLGQRAPYQGSAGAEDGRARLRRVGGLVTTRFVEGKFYSAPGDPGGARVGPVSPDAGDRTHGRGQSDPEADRERQYQAGAGSQ